MENKEDEYVYQPIFSRNFNNHRRRAFNHCSVCTLYGMEEQKKVKQPKKLARWQKECLSAHRLNADNWMLVEETEFYLKIINKETKKTKSVDKFLRPKKGAGR